MCRDANTVFFCFGTVTTLLYTLTLHDALPISLARVAQPDCNRAHFHCHRHHRWWCVAFTNEDHPAEAQSGFRLVCHTFVDVSAFLRRFLPVFLGPMSPVILPRAPNHSLLPATF